MNAPSVKLPSQLHGLALSKVAAEVVTHAQEGWPAELTFDFSTLSFICPAGVVFLSNLVYWLNEKGTNVFFSNSRCRDSGIELSRRFYFFKQHIGQKREIASCSV